jgi:hypothetical protein
LHPIQWELIVSPYVRIETRELCAIAWFPDACFRLTRFSTDDVANIPKDIKANRMNGFGLPFSMNKLEALETEVTRYGAR